MNIVIRVDSSLEIGIGHFMRCLTLADTLRKFGSHVRFVCRHIMPQLNELLVKSEHDILLLEGKDPSILESELEYVGWLGVNQEFDAIETLKVLAGSRWNWVIVDHYALDYRWEDIIKKGSAAKILVIDDLFDKRHICDIFLNQNVINNIEFLCDYKLPENTIRLIGPRYALLRDEFFTARSKVEFRSGPIKNILVSFGGIDINNVTSKVLKAFSLDQELCVNIDVVIGAEHPCIDSIRTVCATKGYTCHVQPDKISELMLAADLAIGAGGSTSWERCCLALPSVIISVADNQVPIVQELDRAGAAMYLGNESVITDKIISKTLDELYDDNKRLFDMSNKAFDMVDGKGKDRVLENIITLQ
ncbi:MAG: UDP-2,4-diacetamido-2,4,6-trideoxy-beta-L-altropyranose hydrolase [Coxiellaceae bacterium]|jgi:UDP-2,4-diacetamido-2,4,6-trideoxy-beta-L-altropyranose hydrolase|nr:UDP-2,4-diacetamido-2,4,6-trideoxy-beta-L-altropyranose hydrolase [Coxiellaceae bacterium]